MNTYYILEGYILTSKILILFFAVSICYRTFIKTENLVVKEKNDGVFLFDNNGMVSLMVSDHHYAKAKLNVL